MPFEFTTATRARMSERLRRLYGANFDADAFVTSLEGQIEQRDLQSTAPSGPMWSESDTVLITYGDQFREDGVAPLQTLSDLLAGRLSGLFSDVHLLPCFPFTSDDGFSVSDYETIDPALGDWDDIAAIRRSTRVAFDLVLNHCSASHEWFGNCLAGRDPGRGYFIEVDPSVDVAGVTRPRSHPLLTEFDTVDGPKSFWTTFSTDQLDLNFANPAVLESMLGVLLTYLSHGGRIIRLDAIAYLWKTIGTRCIHLPQTHEVVKLMRDVVSEAAPEALLLTETNVPHAENVSYFGSGDEAHMVYQFSLAPLLLDAYVHEDASYLNEWLATLEPPPPGCTYFNFTASHDGVGVRPLEGLVPPERIERIVESVTAAGGQVSHKRNSDGSESPYELNITWFSALAIDDESLSVRRFLASQFLQLMLAGIPGIYAHSLFGTPNWNDGVERTGRARTINRRRLMRSEVEDWADDTKLLRGRILRGMDRLLRFRRSRPELHPDRSQKIVDGAQGESVTVVRDGSLYASINVRPEPVVVPSGLTLEPFGFSAYDAAGQELLGSRSLLGG